MLSTESVLLTVTSWVGQSNTIYRGDELSSSTVHHHFSFQSSIHDNPSSKPSSSSRLWIFPKLWTNCLPAPVVKNCNCQHLNWWQSTHQDQAYLQFSMNYLKWGPPKLLLKESRHKDSTKPGLIVFKGIMYQVQLMKTIFCKQPNRIMLYK